MSKNTHNLSDNLIDDKEGKNETEENGQEQMKAGKDETEVQDGKEKEIVTEEQEGQEKEAEKDEQAELIQENEVQLLEYEEDDGTVDHNECRTSWCKVSTKLCKNILKI